MSTHQPWRIAGGRFLLMVRLTPNAAKDAIDGLSSSETPQKNNAAFIKARVRAVPEKGKANAALEKLIAKWLGLAKSDVTIHTGSKSRIKSVALEGDPADLSARITRAIASLP